MIRHLLTVIYATAILVFWQIAASISIYVRLFISSPDKILQYVLNNFSRLLNDALYTSTEAVLGIGMAALIAGAFMTTVHLLPRAEAGVRKLMSFLQVIPLIVFAPLVTMVVGVGILANLLMAALVGFVPLTVVVLDMKRRIPTSAFDFAALMEFGQFESVRTVYLPFLLPGIFTGVRLSALLCVIGAIVAEFSGARFGLGRNIFEASVRIDPELMMSSVLLVGAFSIGVDRLLRHIEGRVVFWRVQ